MKTEQSQPVIFGVETWPDFTIAHGASPPPIATQLAQLSEQLMLAANCHILPTPARAPDPPTFKRALSELSAALAGFGSRAHALAFLNSGRSGSDPHMQNDDATAGNCRGR